MIYMELEAWVLASDVVTLGEELMALRFELQTHLDLGTKTT